MTSSVGSRDLQPRYSWLGGSSGSESWYSTARQDTCYGHSYGLLGQELFSQFASSTS